MKRIAMFCVPWEAPRWRSLGAVPTALWLALISLSAVPGVGRAQAPAADVAGVEVLTRGPVHEAFAGMITFNPLPGIVVTKPPPAMIEELPPDERPVGDQVTWIPGYWAWDDERSDFLWISGTWRALPPGRAWIAGYWAQTAQGYQWTSGYWADAALAETTYLPQPPASLEVGPNMAAPSIDYGWAPGSWVWTQQRYAWRPGYWVGGRADWDWTPPHYVWSPRGYIFIGGFWDYPVRRRGELFAPIYYQPRLFLGAGFHYAPSIVIDLGVFSDHLFLRPSYNHFYFGDYYATSYARGGFYSSFSFQSSRMGYNPVYSHQVWEHRQDRDWGHRMEASYDYRRDHEDARPPRTWADSRNVPTARPGRGPSGAGVAMPFRQMTQRRDGAVSFQAVPKVERQSLAERGPALQRMQDQRRTLESPRAGGPNRGSGVSGATQGTLPRSPIVAPARSSGGRAPAPPLVPPARRDPPNAAPAGQPPRNYRTSPTPEVRKFEPDHRPVVAQPASRPSEGATIRRLPEAPAPSAQPRVLGRQAQGMAAQPVMKRPAPARAAPAPAPRDDRGRDGRDGRDGQRDPASPGRPPKP